VSPSRKPIGRFHVITDTVVQNRYRHAEIARLAIAGGADTIQLRDKRLSDGELAEIARETLAVCRTAGVPLLINDRVDVAGRVGADGVHLGREDAPIASARKALGRGAIVGGTASTADELAAVEAEGADYVGFGHIFATGSKQKTGPPVGVETLRQACASLRIPLIAIGGINAANAAAVVGAGAWGIAVIGAVCGADDPEAAAREIARTLAEAGGNHAN
jgi:thiamine-phosphate pyrophosphorylase